jgi:hypothetical protein
MRRAGVEKTVLILAVVVHRRQCAHMGSPPPPLPQNRLVFRLVPPSVLRIALHCSRTTAIPSLHDPLCPHGHGVLQPLRWTGEACAFHAWSSSLARVSCWSRSPPCCFQTLASPQPDPSRGTPSPRRSSTAPLRSATHHSGRAGSQRLTPWMPGQALAVNV